MRPRTMTAPTRRHAAVEHWLAAEKVRQEWLDQGLATDPAERATTEHTLTTIYARHGRARPRFVWVDSPHRALPHIAGLPTHEVLRQWLAPRQPPGRPPMISDIAAGLSRLRTSLDDSFPPELDPRPAVRKDGKPWPVLPPQESLDAGVPLREVLRRGVRAALYTSLGTGFFLPVRAALAARGQLPSAFYGPQDASWIAHYDMLRRLGLARYSSVDAAHLADWATLARCGGWWWPGEEFCVVVERPAVIRTEPVPNAWYCEVRLSRTARSPVEYRDGWQLPTIG